MSRRTSLRSSGASTSYRRVSAACTLCPTTTRKESKPSSRSNLSVGLAPKTSLKPLICPRPLHSAPLSHKVSFQRLTTSPWQPYNRQILTCQTWPRSRNRSPSPICRQNLWLMLWPKITCKFRNLKIERRSSRTSRKRTLMTVLWSNFLSKSGRHGLVRCHSLTLLRSWKRKVSITKLSFKRSAFITRPSMTLWGNPLSATAMEKASKCFKRSEFSATYLTK